MRLLSKLAILSVIFIYGCSEEELENSPNPQPEPQVQILKGKFIDSEVEGLNYYTPTRNGFTNSSGEFEYLVGEKVTFKVGNILLGTAEGNSIITPLEIASTPNASLETPEVKNLSAFLQTLDSDKNTSNGISISQEALAYLPENQIDFNSNIIETLGNFVLEVNKNTLLDLNVVMPETATVHLASTLDDSYTMKGLESGPFFNLVENLEARTNNVVWIHQFSDEGLLVESNAYSKYPLRHLLQHEYFNHNSNGYPASYTSNHIKQDGSDGWLFYFYIDYGSKADINSIKYTPNPDINNYYGWRIDEVDLNNNVLQTTTLQGNENSTIASYGYDANGKTIFENITDSEASSPRYKREWEYNSFQDISFSEEQYGTNLNTTRTREYKYRDNYILEKLEVVTVQENSETKDIYFYNENEVENRIENYKDGFLYKITETDIENLSRIITYFEQEDNSFYVEYHNGDQGHYKTEYYDSDGNLISTEEH